MKTGKRIPEKPKKVKPTQAAASVTPKSPPWEYLREMKRILPFLGIGRAPSHDNCISEHWAACHRVGQLSDLLMDIQEGWQRNGLPKDDVLASLGEAIRLQAEFAALIGNILNDRLLAASDQAPEEAA